MTNCEIVAGIGLPLCDFTGPVRREPSFRNRHGAIIFASEQRIKPEPSGVIPNIFFAFLQTLERLKHTVNEPKYFIFGQVGIDPLGIWYWIKARRSGIKGIRLYPGSTGITACFYYNGQPHPFHDYGAAQKYTLLPNVRKLLFGQERILFITDLYTLATSCGQVNTALKQLPPQLNLFALNLGGANKVSQNPMKIINKLPWEPQLVFGNNIETKALAGIPDDKEALKRIFPNAPLVVETLSSKGALIRYKGQMIPVPPVRVPPEECVNEIGAGDTFMGTMLACLIREWPSYNNWWPLGDVEEAATLAAEHAALVVRQPGPRLKLYSK